MYEALSFGTYSRFKPFDREGPIKVDVTVKDGDVIGGEDSGVQLEVIHAPGHTPGNIGLYSKKYRTIIGGDCLFKSIFGIQGLITPPPISSIDPLTAAVSALRISENFDFDKLFLAHQDSPILERAREAVKETASKAIKFYNEITRFLPPSA